MDIVNYNNQVPNTGANLTNLNESHLKKETNPTCFSKDNGWSDSAAVAIEEAFSNLDGFLVMVKESQE